MSTKGVQNIPTTNFGIYQIKVVASETNIKSWSQCYERNLKLRNDISSKLFTNELLQLRSKYLQWSNNGITLKREYDKVSSFCDKICFIGLTLESTEILYLTFDGEFAKMHLNFFFWRGNKFDSQKVQRKKFVLLSKFLQGKYV